MNCFWGVRRDQSIAMSQYKLYREFITENIILSIEDARLMFGNRIPP